jgi:hypothetical protein
VPIPVAEVCRYSGVGQDRVKEADSRASSSVSRAVHLKALGLCEWARQLDGRPGLTAYSAAGRVPIGKEKGMPARRNSPTVAKTARLLSGPFVKWR